MRQVFKFRKFDVVNEKSAMKVNTDGVLLGAAVRIFPEDRHILDVGTGTGTIALLAAQRLSEALETAEQQVLTQDERDFKICGLDIDEASALEAAENFGRSPWNSHLKALHTSLQDYLPETSFDLILSNPPYFENSLRNPAERKADARHTDSLSYRELIRFAAEHLKAEGRLALVLPAICEHELCRCARMHSLFPSRILRIRTVPRKSVSRIVAEFARERKETEFEELTIQDKGEYTCEYLALAGKYYLFPKTN